MAGNNPFDRKSWTVVARRVADSAEDVPLPQGRFVLVHLDHRRPRKGGSDQFAKRFTMKFLASRTA
jgi:hypothetical protein